MTNVKSDGRLQSIPVSLILGALALALAFAQTAAADTASPATYVLVRNATSPDDVATAIYRDGSREMIRLSRSGGWHSEMWFDFATHKEYAADSNAPGQCSVIAYTSDGPPPLLDPVPHAFAMAGQIPATAKHIGKAKLGGISTEVIKIPGAPVTLWLDPAHHLVVKYKTVMKIEGNTRPMTVDLTGVRFDKPDPKLLTPPAHCKHIAGKASANGGHASVPVEATS